MGLITPSAFLELMIHSATLVDAYLLSSCDLWHVNVAEVNKWHHRKTTIHMHAENSNGTTVGRVFKFKSFPWLFRAPSLPSALYVIMHSWSEVVGGERPLSARVDDWLEHIQQPLTDTLFRKSLVSCCCRLA